MKCVSPGEPSSIVTVEERYEFVEESGCRALTEVPRSPHPGDAHQTRSAVGLTLAVEADGFVKRPGDLLFGQFAHDAYLMGVFPHGSWTLIDLAEVAVRNWPHATTFQELRARLGLHSLSPPPGR